MSNWMAVRWCAADYVLSHWQADRMGVLLRRESRQLADFMGLSSSEPTWSPWTSDHFRQSSVNHTVINTVMALSSIFGVLDCRE